VQNVSGSGLIMVLFGAGFLVANARIALDYSRYVQRRAGALLTWRPRSTSAGMGTALAFALGALILFKVFYLHMQAFGETMMFAYYAYLLPLSRKIARGFYAEGIWADTGFMPYEEIGGVTWRDGEASGTMIVSSRLRTVARRLAVPGDKYAAAKRIARERISGARTGLGLGDNDSPESGVRSP
jgi:hypothetical protein